MQKLTQRKCLRLRMLSLLAGWLIFSPLTSQAHDYWANGKKVPDWVKSSCCGQADAHALEPGQVHQDKDGNYFVDGYYGYNQDHKQLAKIPAKEALPSQDGHYWIFYRGDEGGGSQSGVYCFFVPMDF